MAEGRLAAALAEMFREVFEGVKPEADGTWFVQGKEAILNSMSSLSPEQASKRIAGQPFSIGSHVWHLNYYLSLFNASTRGEQSDADWDGSWKVQEFDEAAWTSLAQEVAKQYKAALEWYRSPVLTSDDGAHYCVANLAHAAYHLGAIRALMPIVAS